MGPASAGPIVVLARQGPSRTGQMVASVEPGIPAVTRSTDRLLRWLPVIDLRPAGAHSPAPVLVEALAGRRVVAPAGARGLAAPQGVLVSGPPEAAGQPA